MARRKKGSVPGLRHHRPSGKAVVTLSGQDFYCGTWGTKVALAEYDRVVAEWLARGRRPLVESEEHGPITLIELCLAYVEHARVYYRKNGKPTSEVAAVLATVRFIRRLYGREPADDFGPLKLQAIQQAMIADGLARGTINRNTGRIVRIFSWGVTQELARPDVAQALREVGGLHKGRSEARETAPVLPVDEATVQATLHRLPPIVADMVRLQRLTGCRPEEVCSIRPCDVDTSGAVWAYRPQSHKTEHHGRERVIFIGPKGQDVLRPYLLRDKGSYCFSPAESERKRRAEAHQRRRTPIGYGNRPGTNKSSQPKRPAGDRYTTISYRGAIMRACELAFGMPGELRKAGKNETGEQKAARLVRASEWRARYCWSPNRLRHSAATEIRKRFGLEASQVVLGHSAADVTQVYAERDLERAAQVMREVG